MGGEGLQQQDNAQRPDSKGSDGGQCGLFRAGWGIKSERTKGEKIPNASMCITETVVRNDV